MNMKKKILMAVFLAGIGCIPLLPMSTEADAKDNTALIENQAPAFVEVLPKEELIKEQQVSAPAAPKAEAEPETEPEAEPETALKQAPDPIEDAAPSYRDGLAAYITEVNETVTEAEALNMADCILKQAAVHDVDEKLILAVAHTESTYYSDAVSCVNYKGLMQTGDALAEEAGYSPDALFDPEISIAVGTDYIREQLETFDQDVSLALTAYNQGPGAVYEGIYDTAYADLTLERVKNIEAFLQAGGYGKR